jgi:hypothetical protein
VSDIVALLRHRARLLEITSNDLLGPGERATLLEWQAAEEIERLREALREIAGARPKCCEITDAMQYIASAALATGGERGPQ